jgi:cytochrome P450
VLNRDRIKFEPFVPLSSPELLELLRELRDDSPVYHCESDLWVVTRWEDVRHIQSSPEVFSSRANADNAMAMPTNADADPEQLQQLMALMEGFPVDIEELTNARTIIAADPPDHTRIRRIVSRGFTPRRVAQMAETIEAIASDCVTGIEDVDEYEVVERLAVPLPVKMIADLLGVRAENYDDVKRWSDYFVAVVGGALRDTPEGAVLAIRMFKEFSSFFHPLIEERRYAPQQDLISAMVRAVETETLNTPEALMMAITIMVAGNETSTNLIGNTLVALWDNPDQFDLVRDNPDLLPAAVDESNRLTSPIQFNFREALEDVEVSGTVIPKGAIVVLHLASANRDPRQFEDPDLFLVKRPSGKNLAFGHGIHFCIGSHLATQEVCSAVGGLLPHLDRFQLDVASLERQPTMLLNGWQRIPLQRITS